MDIHPTNLNPDFNFGVSVIPPTLQLSSIMNELNTPGTEILLSFFFLNVCMHIMYKIGSPGVLRYPSSPGCNPSLLARNKKFNKSTCQICHNCLHFRFMTKNKFNAKYRFQHDSTKPCPYPTDYSTIAYSNWHLNCVDCEEAAHVLKYAKPATLTKIKPSVLNKARAKLNNT